MNAHPHLRLVTDDALILAREVTYDPNATDAELRDACELLAVSQDWTDANLARAIRNILPPPEPRRVTARDTRGLWLVAATAVICAALLVWGLSALADLIAANAVAQASVPGLGRW